MINSCSMVIVVVTPLTISLMVIFTIHKISWNYYILYSSQTVKNDHKWKQLHVCYSSRKKTFKYTYVDLRELSNVGICYLILKRNIQHPLIWPWIPCKSIDVHPIVHNCWPIVGTNMPGKHMYLNLVSGLCTVSSLKNYFGYMFLCRIIHSLPLLI